MALEFEAMGTTVVVRADSSERIDRTRRLFETVEQACSRFRADSELTVVNHRLADRVRLSPLLQQVIGAADRARQLTGGLVDAGIGSTVIDWGYDRTFPRVEDRSAAPMDSRAPDWELVGPELRRPTGVSLDLGGIAKGWTCDQAVKSGLATLASAGGDLRSADPATLVDVLDPWGEPVATVHVGVGALATSSVTRRRWKVGGHDAHHLIDPRTLRPADSPVLSAPR